jgi:hypothetical protein
LSNGCGHDSSKEPQYDGIILLIGIILVERLAKALDQELICVPGPGIRAILSMRPVPPTKSASW